MSGTGHTVKSYEEEMQSLNDNLVMMGSLTESQMADAMSAVIKVDKESVDKIVKSDGKINELRSIIDNQITTVLVKRAPMAIGALFTNTVVIWLSIIDLNSLIFPSLLTILSTDSLSTLITALIASAI